MLIPKLNREKFRNVIRRAMWLFMALLFIFTGVGIGVYAFWQATHQPDDTSQTTPPPENQLRDKKLTNFTPIEKVDSLQKIDTKTGNGAEAKPGSKVTVLYTGAVAATGVIFDSTEQRNGQPASFELKGGPGGIIQGWVDGLPGMKAGGERRLLIPATLAYGGNPPPGSGIPAGADLVFDVTLVAVQ
jgi:FKBP-type peptidyl-prolyl cis-trans isomerase